MKLVTAVILLCTISFISCETVAASRVPTPRERVTECEKICTDVGLKLAAFVVMMSSAGCVCEPQNAAALSTPSSGGGTAAGATTIAAAAAAAQAAQQQQVQYRTIY